MNDHRAALQQYRTRLTGRLALFMTLRKSAQIVTIQVSYKAYLDDLLERFPTGIQALSALLVACAKLL